MFCRKCGKEMLDTDKYCLHCGFDNLSNTNSTIKNCSYCNKTFSMFDSECQLCYSNPNNKLNNKGFHKIECPVCKKETPFESGLCVHCGHSWGKPKKDINNHSTTNPISIIILFIAIGIAVSMMISLADDFSRFGGNGSIINTNYNYSTTNSTVEITLEEFYKIKNGMTYEEVKNIVGCSGTLSSETEYMGIKSHIITWNGKAAGANAVIMFENGKVISKTQIGLE